MAESLDLSEGLDVKHISDHYLSIINKIESNVQQNEQLIEGIQEDEIKESEELILLEMAENLCDIFVSLQEQKQKLIDIRMKLLNDTLDTSQKDMNDVIDDTNSKLCHFKESYKNCEIYLEGILRKAEEELTTFNPRRSDEDYFTFFFINEEDLASYFSIIESSRKSFSVFVKDTEMKLISQPLSLYPYNTVISAINEAAVSCEELTTIAFKLLNLD